jgi:hypothetical protein
VQLRALLVGDGVLPESALYACRVYCVADEHSRTLPQQSALLRALDHALRRVHAAVTAHGRTHTRQLASFVKEWLLDTLQMVQLPGVRPLACVQLGALVLLALVGEPPACSYLPGEALSQLSHALRLMRSAHTLTAHRARIESTLSHTLHWIIGNAPPSSAPVITDLDARRLRRLVHF